MKKKTKIRKEALIWVLAGIAVLLMAYLERRVRLFYILGAFLIFIGVLQWIIENPRKGVKK